MNEANGVISVPSSFFVFRGVGEERVRQLVASITPQVSEYKRGEVIFSPDEFEPRLGLVLDGVCEVVRFRSDGAPVPLNRLERGGSFGILSLFSDAESFPTSIIAAKACTVAFFSKSQVLELMRLEPTVAANVPAFLADRIRFLNEKIATLTSGSSENRLAAYLYGEYERYGAEFSINCKRTSEALGLGRASFYRALKQLVDEGLIEYDTKKIYIKSQQGLERKTKK